MTCRRVHTIHVHFAVQTPALVSASTVSPTRYSGCSLLHPRETRAAGETPSMPAVATRAPTRPQASTSLCRVADTQATQAGAAAASKPSHQPAFEPYDTSLHLSHTRPRCPRDRVGSLPSHPRLPPPKVLRQQPGRAVAFLAPPAASHHRPACRPAAGPVVVEPRTRASVPGP